MLETAMNRKLNTLAKRVSGDSNLVAVPLPFDSQGALHEIWVGAYEAWSNRYVTFGPNASLPDPAKRETSRGLSSPLPGHDVLAHPAVPAPPGRTHVRVSVQERPWRPTRCAHSRRRRPGVRLRSPAPRREGFTSTRTPPGRRHGDDPRGDGPGC